MRARTRTGDAPGPSCKSRFPDDSPAGLLVCEDVLILTLFLQRVVKDALGKGPAPRIGSACRGGRSLKCPYDGHPPRRGMVPRLVPRSPKSQIGIAAQRACVSPLALDRKRESSPYQSIQRGLILNSERTSLRFVSRLAC